MEVKEINASHGTDRFEAVLFLLPSESSDKAYPHAFVRGERREEALLITTHEKPQGVALRFRLFG